MFPNRILIIRFTSVWANGVYSFFNLFFRIKPLLSRCGQTMPRSVFVRRVVRTFVSLSAEALMTFLLAINFFNLLHLPLRFLLSIQSMPSSPSVFRFTFPPTHLQTLPSRRWKNFWMRTKTFYGTPIYFVVESFSSVLCKNKYLFIVIEFEVWSFSYLIEILYIYTYINSILFFWLYRPYYFMYHLMIIIIISI